MRIFQFAKEINLDSKAVVELCTRLGIANKGSPLANLEDDEAEKIRRHLSNDSSGSSAPAAAPSVEHAPTPTPERPSIRESNPMRQLNTRRRATTGAAPLAARGGGGSEVEAPEETTAPTASEPEQETPATPPEVKAQEPAEATAAPE